MKVFLLILFALLVSFAKSQTINGTITNSSGKPVAYATIYIEELQTGTSANHEGKYQLHVTKGIYTLSFRAMGLSPQTKKVIVGKDDVVLDVNMSIQSYILAGVTVRADAEDPAYSIMRKAISRAPGFLNQAESYSAEVYIKATVKVHKIPKILQNQLKVDDEKIKEGETYVNESLNKISFTAPDNYVQEVISVNNSFPVGDSDVPVMEMLSGSIYESNPDLYISPFSPNAFLHYRFKYEGLLQDGALFINKIRVIPRRKSQLLVSGYLYIVEDLWCLYSYDLKLSQSYVTLSLKQHFAPVKENNFFPVNMFASADMKMMGVKISATYTTTISYSDVILNPDFVQTEITENFDFIKKQTTDSVTKPKVNKNLQKIDKKLEELAQKEEPTNRDMIQMQKLMTKKATLISSKPGDDPLEIKSTYRQIVKDDALIRDSVYWDSIRPVPASSDEKISYKKVIDKKQKQDSASVFAKAMKIATFGNYEWERSRKVYAFYPGLISLRNIGFNPVDGLQIKQYVKFRWNIDSLSFLEIKTHAGYAWSREAFFGKTNIWYKYDFINDKWFNLLAGWIAEDFNNLQGTPQNINALYNLLLKDNYVKLYNHKYIKLVHRRDIINGMSLTVGTKWRFADTLSNTTNYSFFYKDSLYAPNIPMNREITTNTLNPSYKLLLSATLQYTPKRYYKIDKGRKHYLSSKFPTFYFHYSYAVPVSNEYASYQKTEFSVTQNIDFYGISSLNYSISAGAFFDKKNMHFSDFRHFRTFEEPFTLRKFNDGFMLLNNYEYSTSKQYAEAHIRYTSQFLFFKRLPFISNTFWNENLYFNTLFVDGHYPYYEAGYSLGQLFYSGEVGIFTGFRGSEFYSYGIRARFIF